MGQHTNRKSDEVAMSVRTHLEQAQIELLAAKRRAEEFHLSDRLQYEIEVLLRATSRTKENLEKELGIYGKKKKAS